MTTRVYFDMAADGKALGRIVFEVWCCMIRKIYRCVSFVINIDIAVIGFLSHPNVKFNVCYLFFRPAASS